MAAARAPTHIMQVCVCAVCVSVCVGTMHTSCHNRCPCCRGFCTHHTGVCMCLVCVCLCVCRLQTYLYVYTYVTFITAAKALVQVYVCVLVCVNTTHNSLFSTRHKLTNIITMRIAYTHTQSSHSHTHILSPKPPQIVEDASLQWSQSPVALHFWVSLLAKFSAGSHQPQPQWWEALSAATLGSNSSSNDSSSSSSSSVDSEASSAGRNASMKESGGPVIENGQLANLLAAYGALRCVLVSLCLCRFAYLFFVESVVWILSKDDRVRRKIRVLVQMHTHVHTQVCTSLTHTHTRAHTHTHMPYSYTYTHTHVHIRTHTHTHARTHIHTERSTGPAWTRVEGESGLRSLPCLLPIDWTV